jgi:hypothetical protein
MYVFVLSKSGIPLTPTTAYRARRLLKNKKAVIEKYDPFNRTRKRKYTTGRVQM